MLKASLKMLEKPSKTRVECARAVLEEVIVHLEKSPPPTLEGPFSASSDEGLSEDARAAKAELDL